ncbi:hypothetical protein LTR15_007196 [Elasticomyces elasticus]|nr:hypothetical protein LTR15_007196 [Elasticomyces elasticus]
MLKQHSTALVSLPSRNADRARKVQPSDLVKGLPVRAGAPWATIAVMGVTGAGKSTFIRTVSGDSSVVVGDSLRSCTSELMGYSFYYQGYNVNLIDTPGFNDTFRSETDVLQDISEWLSESYEMNNKLTGIIYLHGINHSRVEGSALRNLKMFRELCGPEPLKNVVLATTFWSDVDPVAGTNRETELAAENAFWGGMLRRGSRMARFTDRDSGLEILQNLVGLVPETLKIQQEMVEDSKALVDTGAGRIVNEELTRLNDKHNEALTQMRVDMKIAMEEKDAEMQSILREQSEKLRDELNRVQRQQEQLKADRRAEARRMQNELDAAIFDLKRQKDQQIARLQDNVEHLQGDVKRRQRERRAQEERFERLAQSSEQAHKEHEARIEELHVYNQQTRATHEQRLAELQRYNERAEAKFEGLDIDGIIAKVRAEESRLRPGERAKLEEEIENVQKTAKDMKRGRFVGIFFSVLRAALSIASLVTLGVPIVSPGAFDSLGGGGG